MLRKKNSQQRSRASSEASVSRPSRLARSLLKSIGEAKEFVEGKRALLVRDYNVPDSVDVGAIRKRTRMSQAQFALSFAINPRTLQQWEQGVRIPDATVRAYLTVIDRNPKAVEKALRQ